MIDYEEIITNCIGIVITSIIPCVVTNIINRFTNKKQICWIKEKKNASKYINIVMSLYKVLTVEFILIASISAILSIKTGNKYLYFMFGIIYIVISSMSLAHTFLRLKRNGDLIHKKKQKEWVLISIYSIFGFIYLGFWIDGIVLIFICLIFIWAIVFLVTSETITVIDSSFANFYMKDGSIIAEISTVNIRQDGEWIRVNYKDHDECKEIYFRESEVIKIEYDKKPKVCI